MQQAGEPLSVTPNYTYIQAPHNRLSFGALRKRGRRESAAYVKEDDVRANHHVRVGLLRPARQQLSWARLNSNTPIYGTLYRSFAPVVASDSNGRIGLV